MRTPQVVLLAAVVSFVASVLTVKLLPIRSAAGDLDSIRREQAQLREAVEELRSSARPGADRTGMAPGVTPAEVEAIVSRAIEELVKRDEPASADPGAVAAAVQRLLDPSLSDAGRDAIWEQLNDAGMLGAVVAEFERRARASPQDASAQADLAAAYHQKERFSKAR